MHEQAIDALKEMSRQQLEELAIRAVIQIRRDKSEKGRNMVFLSIFGGFMLGTLVAVSGFVTGSMLR